MNSSKGLKNGQNKGDENMAEIKKKINIEGENVHNVGYRPSLLARALRLRVKNFDAENIEENGIQKLVISVGGDEEKISEFEKFVNDKKNIPKNAKVSNISTEECVSDIMSIEEYRKLLNSEQLDNIVQGGLKIVDILKNETDKNLELLRTETTENFEKMDIKYDAISKAMFATVDAIEKRNQILEKRMDNTDRNIESLLKILVEKK